MPPTYGKRVLNLPSHWRAGTTSDSGAFLGGKWGRPLRLIIDHPSLPDDAALRLLDAFTGRSDAQLFSTDVVRPWHVEISPEANANQALTVSFVEPDGGGVDCAVWAPPWRPHAEQTVAEYDGDVEETYGALVLAQASARHDLDGFVTSFPFAERGWRSFAQKAHVQDAREAAALLGLYLRAHADFTVQQEGNHGTFLEPHNFYAGAAVAPLGRYPDWLRLAVGCWRSGRGAAAHDLLRGLELRLGRALRARDYFMVRTRALRPDDSWEEALFFFEAFLLSAAGALDALARYCHVAADLGGSRQAAGWRKRDWREKLLEARPELAPVIGSENTRLRATNEVIGLLRNYIHGEALTQQRSDDDQPGITGYMLGKLVIGGRDAKRLREAAAHLPGLDGAVAEEWPEGVASLLPARLLPPLIANLYAAVNELMDAFALDQPTLRAAEPFAPDDFWIPGASYSENLVLLCGLPLSDAASADYP